MSQGYISDSAVHAVAGAGGGIVAMAITYPLVNLSTRSQVAAKKDPHTNFRSAILKVLKDEGVRGLYDGLNSSLVGIAVTNGVYYLFFEETRALVLKSKGQASKALSTLESILTGFLAGCATSIISNPIWVINTRQSTRSVTSANGTSGTPKKSSDGFFETGVSMLKEEGPLSFFRGLGPALILVINPILQYTLFEQLKNIIIQRRKLAGKSLALTDIHFFVLGAISKLFATGITYPYVTVKSRMQAARSHGAVYKSSWDGLSQIVKTDGIQGLYRGIGPKLTQSVLTAAILFLAKERLYQVTNRILRG